MSAETKVFQTGKLRIEMDLEKAVIRIFEVSNFGTWLAGKFSSAGKRQSVWGYSDDPKWANKVQHEREAGVEIPLSKLSIRWSKGIRIVGELAMDSVPNGATNVAFVGSFGRPYVDYESKWVTSDNPTGCRVEWVAQNVVKMDFMNLPPEDAKNLEKWLDQFSGAIKKAVKDEEEKIIAEYQDGQKVRKVERLKEEAAVNAIAKDAITQRLDTWGMSVANAKMLYRYNPKTGSLLFLLALSDGQIGMIDNSGTEFVGSPNGAVATVMAGDKPRDWNIEIEAKDPAYEEKHLRRKRLRINTWDYDLAKNIQDFVEIAASNLGRA